MALVSLLLFLLAAFVAPACSLTADGAVLLSRPLDFSSLRGEKRGERGYLSKRNGVLSRSSYREKPDNEFTIR